MAAACPNTRRRVLNCGFWSPVHTAISRIVRPSGLPRTWRTVVSITSQVSGHFRSSPRAEALTLGSWSPRSRGEVGAIDPFCPNSDRSPNTKRCSCAGLPKSSRDRPTQRLGSHDRCDLPSWHQGIERTTGAPDRHMRPSSSAARHHITAICRRMSRTARRVPRIVPVTFDRPSRRR